MKAETILINIGTLLNPMDSSKPLKGVEMSRVETLNDAFIAIKNGLILDYGIHPHDAYIDENTTIIDVKGKLVTPGLIDSHTHVVHAGSREHEFELKMKGVPYLDILKSGGGIHSTVNATRNASFETLFNQTSHSLDQMLLHGVTTVEGKSGYGLEWETEYKQLSVLKKLQEIHPIDIISTFMGAHALPKSHQNNKEAFIDEVIQMLHEVKKQNLAEFVDIFCEQGVFDLEDSRKVLSAAKQCGFKLKIHADEIVSLGGVGLAKELEAASADHLMAIDDIGLNALSNSDVIANILPGTSFYLNHAYAPVREMIDHHIAIALSSDYNPGSCPTENYLFILNLAAIQLKMSPEEILNAATINGAYSVDRAHQVGRIKKDYKADIVIYDAKNWPYVLYHFAINHVCDVFKNGKHVVKNKSLIWR